MSHRENPNDPIARFGAWFSEAKAHSAIADASAMSVATVDVSGGPSVRVVLLKSYDARGFVFYTNLNSPKARDLSANPRAALCFHWAPLKKQVRVEGAVEPTTAEEADAYFATRPRLSQLGSWASAQSEPMPHRFALETSVARVTARFGIGLVPRPPNWSGFRVVPQRIEFWMEGPFRLHSRGLFTRTDAGWQEQRLFP